LLSSRSFKVSVLGIAVAIAGCNRERGENAQPQAEASTAEAAPATPETPTGTIDRASKGKAMPDLTLSDAAGKQATLASFKGKPLLVNLWATWCAPCVVELPMLDKLAADRAGELKVLTVSQDMASTAPQVAPFLKDKGVANLEPWLDPDGAVAAQYGVTTLPMTIYYDAEGREVWRYAGAHDWTGAEAARMLSEAK
jgi:thiol-disulfide isomerase/thioredoxin